MSKLTRRNVLTAGTAAIGSSLLPNTAVGAVRILNPPSPLVTLAQQSLVNLTNMVQNNTVTRTAMSENVGVLSMLFASWEQDGTAAKMQSYLTKDFLANFQVTEEFKSKIVTSSNRAGANLAVEDLARLDNVEVAGLSLKVTDHLATIVKGLRGAVRSGTYLPTFYEVGAKCELENVTDAAVLTAALSIFFDPVVSAIFGLIAGLSAIASRYWC
jgi:hypothetical protein